MSGKKRALLILPKNQYSEADLKAVETVLAEAGVSRVALTRTGREARGDEGGHRQPDGPIVDWDKQPGFAGKYDAVILIGGRGAKKSLWDDPIVKEILADHFRAGKLIGALGLAVGVLARAGFLSGAASAPDDDPALMDELKRAGVALSGEAVSVSGEAVTGQGGEAAACFARAIAQRLGAA